MLIKVQKRMESGIQTREHEPAGPHRTGLNRIQLMVQVKAPLLPPGAHMEEEGTVKDY